MCDSQCWSLAPRWCCSSVREDSFSHPSVPLATTAAFWGCCSVPQAANCILSGEEMRVKRGGLWKCHIGVTPTHKYKPFEGVLWVFLTFCPVKMSPNEGNTEHGVGWAWLGNRELLLLKCVPRDWTPWHLDWPLHVQYHHFLQWIFWLSLGIYLAAVKGFREGSVTLTNWSRSIASLSLKGTPHVTPWSLFPLDSEAWILFVWVFMRCFGTFPSLLTSRAQFHTP